MTPGEGAAAFTDASGGMPRSFPNARGDVGGAEEVGNRICLVRAPGNPTFKIVDTCFQRGKRLAELPEG